MKIGIIGASTVGTTLGAQFRRAGHEVLIANSRGPASLQDIVAKLDMPPTPVSTPELLDAADLVVLAVPWARIRDVLTPDIGWRERTLVDATNIFLSYAPDFRVDDLGGESGSEIVARLAPSAKVVKAFNTLPFETMFALKPDGFGRVLFLAGDDEGAVGTVSNLVSAIGFRPVALGPLATGGRLMELGGPLSALELLTPAEAA